MIYKFLTFLTLRKSLIEMSKNPNVKENNYQFETTRAILFNLSGISVEDGTRYNFYLFEAQSLARKAEAIRAEIKILESRRDKIKQTPECEKSQSNHQ